MLSWHNYRKWTETQMTGYEHIAAEPAGSAKSNAVATTWNLCRP